MNWELVQRIALGLSVFLFFGTATIGFKWVHSPYVWGYVSSAVGFYCLSLFAATFVK